MWMVTITPIHTVISKVNLHGHCFHRCDLWDLTASSCLLVDVLTRVVNAGLDDVIHGEATGGGLAPQLAVDLLVQHLHGRRTGRWLHARATPSRWESCVVFLLCVGHIWQKKHLGHVVVVQGEVGELLLHGELHLVVVVTVLCHGCDSYSVWGKHKKSVWK